MSSLLWSQLSITNTQQESQLSCQGQPVRATSHKLRQLLPSGTVGNQKPIYAAHMKYATKQFLISPNNYKCIFGGGGQKLH